MAVQWQNVFDLLSFQYEKSGCLYIKKYSIYVHEGLTLGPCSGSYRKSPEYEIKFDLVMNPVLKVVVPPSNFIVGDS